MPCHRRGTHLKHGLKIGSRLLLVAGTLAVSAMLAHAQVVTTKEHKIRIVPVSSGLEHPWSLAFLPDGRMLVTERAGRLRVIDRDGRVRNIHV